MTKEQNKWIKGSVTPNKHNQDNCLVCCPNCENVEDLPLNDVVCDTSTFFTCVKCRTEFRVGVVQQDNSCIIKVLEESIQNPNAEPIQG